MHQVLLTHPVPHNQATSVFFGVALTGPITEQYPQIKCHVLCLAYPFHINYWYQKSNIFDPNIINTATGHKQTTIPMFVKPNIFL